MFGLFIRLSTSRLSASPFVSLKHILEEDSGEWAIWNGLPLLNHNSYNLQILADLENHALFKDDLECQKLILEAMKYHLLPERRTLMQSPRTKPRKSTVGTLYAVGGMDNNKGTS